MSETLLWTAFPNGIVDGNLRISVRVTFRLLDPGFSGVGAYPTLDAKGADGAYLFPNALQWDPAKLTFQLFLGGAEIYKGKALDQVVPKLWQAYFVPTGPVDPFLYTKQGNRKLQSYSTAATSAYLNEVFSLDVVAGFTSPFEPNPLEGSKNPYDVRLLARNPLLTVFDELEKRGKGQEFASLAAMARDKGEAPTNPLAILYEALNFHRAHPKKATGPVRSGARLAPVAKPEIDFHRAMSMLTQHPILMRQLGVVFDFVVPYKGADGEKDLSVEVSGLSAPAKMVYPKTRTRVNLRSFAAVETPDGLVKEGMLNLSPGRAEVLTMDMDGGMLKLDAFGASVQQMVANPGIDLPRTQNLPKPRTAGIAVAVNNRAGRLMGDRTTSDANNAKAEAGTPVELYAGDLVSGWRADIFHGTTWHSLMQRSAYYRVGDTFAKTVPEPIASPSGSDPSKVVQHDGDGSHYEGSITTALTNADDGSGAQKLHEVLFTWDGWSLAAPKPSVPLGNAGVPDPTCQPTSAAQFDTWYQTPGNIDAHYKMAAFFEPKRGSLPSLRYGEWYGVRARAVDQAGNSLPLSTESDPKSVGVTTQVTPFLRFEPIPSPALYMKGDPANIRPGDSPNVVVIRKFLAPQTTGDLHGRHIVPPPGGPNFAELHKMLDDSTGRIDPAKYGVVTGVEANKALAPVIPDAAVTSLPYLPDPTSQGAVLTVEGLPPTPAVPFYGAAGVWPTISPVQLDLQAGAFGITVTNGVLRVQLEPGRVANAVIHSSTSVDFLVDFYQTWVMEFLLESQGKSMLPAIKAMTAKPTPAQNQIQAQSHLQIVTKHQDLLQLPIGSPATDIGKEVLEGLLAGKNRALTPYRQVTLVHATQVPEPGFEFVETLATRQLGQTNATFHLKFKSHSWSTLNVEYQVTAVDEVDDLSEPRRTTTQRNVDSAFIIDVPRAAKDPVALQSDTLSQEYHSTKARALKINAIAKTRFRDYFPSHFSGRSTERFTETYSYTNPVVSDPALKPFLIIPSTKRPDPVPLEYVIPSFAWLESKPQATIPWSIRKGSLLRIYMRRPWFSSGNGELLGIVLPNIAVATVAGTGISAIGEHLSSRVGSDPAFGNQPWPGNPGTQSEFGNPTFPNALGISAPVPLAEDPTQLVKVAFFNPLFDEDRQMWYVDVDIETGFKTYTPFVRLALVRYQPFSLPGCEISKVTLADFAQLQPDRFAFLQVVTPGKQIRVALFGVVGQSAKGPNVAYATLQKKLGADPDLGWVDAVDSVGDPIVCQVPLSDTFTPPTPTPVNPPAPAPALHGVQLPNALSHMRQIQVPMVDEVSPALIFKTNSDGILDLPGVGVYRVVIREYEVHENFATPLNRSLGNRLVHSDVLPVP